MAPQHYEEHSRARYRERDDIQHSGYEEANWDGGERRVSALYRSPKPVEFDNTTITLKQVMTSAVVIVGILSGLASVWFNLTNEITTMKVSNDYNQKTYEKRLSDMEADTKETKKSVDKMKDHLSDIDSSISQMIYSNSNSSSKRK